MSNFTTAWLRDLGSLRVFTPFVSRSFAHRDPRALRSSIIISAQSQGMSKDLWALDFDGVVCNSVGESSQSAWQVKKHESILVCT